MSNKSFKQTLFEQLAKVAKALSSASRLQLLEYLAQGERNVDSLTRVSGLSKANVSQHLQQLKSAGLVSARKEGLHVFYSLKDDSIISLMSDLRAIAEKNIADINKVVDSYLKIKDAFEPVPAEELWKRAKDSLVTVLDVRPPEEYEAGHIPGAVNIPLKELGEHLKRLDKKQQVVAYCRGPYCVLAFDAVAKLRREGFDAVRLENGFPEWKKAGMPVETGRK